ncbi:MAG: T9SS type A sorting domain-containing protein [Flavobacterium sp.]|nr:T9SS type A sorting domain-containing protein [Flavobacterium sp.]
MKKILQTLVLLLLLSATVKSQTTYYWVGGNGTTATRIAWNNPASWNTAIDGTGTGRTTPTSTDILIFDGSAPSLSSSKLVYIDAARDSIAQLQLVNGITVTVVSTVAGNTDVAGSVTYGTSSSACVTPIYGTNFTSIFNLGDYVSTNASNTNMSQVIGINGPDTLYVAAENALAANAAATLYKATTIYITGNPGLTIDATSIFNYGLGSTTTMNCLVLKLTNTATGNIYGQFNFQGRGPAGRLCATTVGSLRFKAGSSCYNGTNHGAITPNVQPYAFGHPMTTGSLAAGNLVFVSGETVVFEKGGTFTHAQVGSGGSAYKMNSPFGITSNLGNTLYPFVPSVSFLPGSNYVFAYGNGYQPYFYSGATAKFGNLKFTGGGMPISAAGKTNITLNAAYIDTLFLSSSNSGVNTANNGTINVYGGVVNNNNNVVAVNLGVVNFKGSVAPVISGATATSFNTTSFSSGIANNSTSTTAVNFGNAMFIGKNVQTVTTGATTLAPAFGTITLADNSVFQLSQNTTVTGAITNNGTLNVTTYTIDGGTTGSFINNSATNLTYNQPNGSNEVSGGVKTTANSTAFFIRGINSTLVPIGSTISSTSHPSIFPAGTYVASYSAGGNFTASNPATITADSASTPTLSLTFTNSAGTFVTASTSGMDGSLINMASSTLNTGASYVFNAATATPFSSAAATNINAGNVTLTGATTLNKRLLNVAGNLTLGTGNLTVNTGDTIVVKAGNSVSGSATGFVDTKVDVATGAKAVLGIEGFTTTRTFPVGTNGNYLPVTITPDTLSNFYVTAFNNATVDGTPNGTALTASQKDTSVNAIYLVNRTSPTSDHTYTLTLGYPSALKGATFATYTNQIGISNYNGSSWSASHGFGDNTSNIATDTVSTSGTFYVTRNATPITILPVKVGALSALLVGANAVKVSWNVYDEVNIDQYVVEASANGVSFAAIGTVKASGNNTYSLVDNNISGAVVYYRVKSIDKGTGAINYSTVVSIALNAAKVASVNVYPNPVVGSELHLQTTNFKAGKLQLMLYNNQGKQIAQQALTYNGGNMAQTLILSNAVKAGTYQLVVTDGTSSISKTIFVVR